MSWTLYLNDSEIMRGDYKSLNMLFGCLSGVSFARASQPGWLDKMSSTTSYEHYLNIKAKEFGIERWHGQLELRNKEGCAERVFFFEQHIKVLGASDSDQQVS